MSAYNDNMFNVIQEQLCVLHCFMNDIDWVKTLESKQESDIIDAIRKTRWDWDYLMKMVAKIEDETNETVKIDGDTIEIYGSINPSIVVSDLKMNKKSRLIEALYLYVQKR